MKRMIKAGDDTSQALNCATYGIYINRPKYQKMFDKIRCTMVDYKNGFIKYIWKNLYEYSDKDEQFKEAINVIKLQNKHYGNAVFKSDLDDNVIEAYNYFNKIVFSKDRVVDLNNLLNDYMRNASKYFNIYLPDDMRNNALMDVISGFEKMKDKSAKSIGCKRYDDLNALVSKPMFPKSRETGEVNYNKSQR